MSMNWLSLDAALIKTLNAATPVIDHEIIPISKALGRVTASNITASESVPPWDNSSMDGFAVNTADLEKSTNLAIQGVITAGMEASEPLKPHHAIKIMTGAPIPPGSDAVVMVENTQVSENTVSINVVPNSGTNIRRKSSDIQCGQSIVPKGTRLKAQHLMLLSSQGLSEVLVYRHVRIGVIATGSELAEPGTARLPSQIYESNRVGVSALLSELNIKLVDFGIVKDDKSSLKQALINASQQVDIIVSSGGVSVGDADYVKEIIEELGDINFWKVAIKPGKPFALGKLGNTLFCGLPGNPVSAFVTTKLLVAPLVRKTQGEASIKAPLTMNATLTNTINRKPGRRDFQRATMSYDENDNLLVTPFHNQNSGVMTSITSSNCFMVLDENLSCIEAGTRVPVIPFDLTAP